MVVHPGAGHHNGTLVNALIYHCGQQLSGIGGQARPGIVHRLDRDTSGLLIVAKNDNAHNSLAEQLKLRTLIREYRALVWGNIEDEQGTIEAAIGRHQKDRKRMAVNPPGRQRNAVTHYTVEERFELSTYLKIRLETGRTHQIRVHLQHRHHPVIGDPVYGGDQAYVNGLWIDKRSLANQILKKIGRQALHAKRLVFIHPATKKQMEFDTDLPEDFKDLLIFVRDKR